MEHPNQELQRLEAIARQSQYAAGLNQKTVEYAFRVLSRHFHGSSLLEVGPAEGIMTEYLAQMPMAVTVVEGAATFCEDLGRRFPHIQVVHSLFEEYRTGQTFDNIVVSQILEHVEDPVAMMKQAAALLKPGGRILAAVPNSRSIHRIAAVMMDLLPAEDALNEMDIHHGHRRVFNPESFRNLFKQARLNIDLFGGFWLKPLSNSQIENTWTPPMIEAFMQLGERFPDIAALIYVVASKQSGHA